jgi:hypothetical protein
MGRLLAGVDLVVTVLGPGPIERPVDAVGSAAMRKWRRQSNGHQDAATALSEAAGERFDVVLGRFHDGPIGPHPMGSRQTHLRQQIGFAGSDVG